MEGVRDFEHSTDTFVAEAHLLYDLEAAVRYVEKSCTETMERNANTLAALGERMVRRASELKKLGQRTETR